MVRILLDRTICIVSIQIYYSLSLLGLIIDESSATFTKCIKLVSVILLHIQVLLLFDHWAALSLSIWNERVAVCYLKNGMRLRRIKFWAWWLSSRFVLVSVWLAIFLRYHHIKLYWLNAPCKLKGGRDHFELFCNFFRYWHYLLNKFRI